MACVRCVLVYTDFQESLMRGVVHASHPSPPPLHPLVYIHCLRESVLNAWSRACITSFSTFPSASHVRHALLFVCIFQRWRLPCALCKHASPPPSPFLQAEADAQQAVVEELRSTSNRVMWANDLEAFLEVCMCGAACVAVCTCGRGDGRRGGVPRGAAG